MKPTYDPMLYATDRRAILFVDAGYLLQVMKAHHGASRLSDLQVDNPKLIEVLRTRAESALGCPVLRIYWYDAEHPLKKIPNLLAAEMQRVDGVRVRLGTLIERSPGTYEQKAVDTLLVRDMITHAFKKTAQEMVLVSGDNDLVPGVEEAQEQGARVHLWAIVGDDLPPSVGRQLANLVDTRSDLSVEDLAGSISGPAPVAGVAVAPPAGEISEPMEPAPALPPNPLRVPSPVSVAPAAPKAAPAPPAPITPKPVAAGSDGYAILYDLSKDDYRAPVDQPGPRSAGREYAKRWAHLVGRSEVERVLREHVSGFGGNIPKQLDSDLLYFGGDHGIDTYVHALKLALRDGFWEGVEEAARACEPS